MSLSGLLNQTVTLKRKSGLDKNGRASYGSATSYKARVQLTKRTRLLPNQQAVTIDAIMYFLPSVTLDAGDKITYSSTDYRVFGTHNAIDGTGSNNHTKVECMRWLD